MNKLLKIAIPLLQTINPRTLDQIDQTYILSACSGLAAMAAAVSLEAGDSAFESLLLLELGRGVMASVQMQTRGDITELEEKYPDSDLLEKFKNLQEYLASPRPSGILAWEPTEQGSRSSLRYMASTQFDSVVEGIRALPGFEGFLQGISSTGLMELALPGPIVVLNAAPGFPRSDAFIVTSVKIGSIPLPLLRYSDLESNFTLFRQALGRRQLKTYVSAKADIRRVLEWLWDVAVGPVLDALCFRECPANGSAWPHVWWVGTGMLSFLPIHAAGYNSDGSGPNTLDRVISSYAPTIQSLSYAREKTKKVSFEQPKAALLVSMPETPKVKPLVHVEAEVKELERIISTSMVKHILQRPTKKQVISLLDSCPIAHFACHGRSAVDDPSKSTLLLDDWEDDPLTVLIDAETCSIGLSLCLSDCGQPR
jgi:hypothetical protein